MKKPTRARKRKLETAKADLEPLLVVLWRAGWALCVSEREVDPPLHRSGASANQAAHPASHSGVDSEVKSADPGLGRVLQESSHPKTLQSARQLDCAAATVAPIQTLAEYRLATASQNQAVRRVWVGELDRFDSFNRSPQQRVIVKAVYGKTVCTV